MGPHMSIAGLRQAYSSGELTPPALMQLIRKRAARYTEHNIWIHLLSEEEQLPFLENLADLDPSSAPLWGVPFAIKDNIDLSGVPTTVACDAFAYTPKQSATVVNKLLAAGAIPVGKTNLDQFATGLNGTRSPLGPCLNSFDPAYISGGSSSGSAVAVALGMATFSLGTDTAGSGRVPACFNNLVGVKPTRGLLSNTGVVPACRSLDCVSIFAFDSDDADIILDAAEGYDATDGCSRRNPWYNTTRNYGRRTQELRLGVIPEAQLKFFGDETYRAAYAATLEALSGQGFTFVEIDYEPFDEAARLLYEGPWVSERYLAASPLIHENPLEIFPVVRNVIAPGADYAATELFNAEYRLAELRQTCEAQLADLDCLLTPTAGRHFTVDEMLAEPIKRNSQLGYYTNFMNLLDMASVAVPTHITPGGMPFGITLVGKAFSDRALLSIANRMQQLLPLPLGATGMARNELSDHAVSDTQTIDVVVCGAHMSGLPLNWQLTERGANLLETTQTAPSYRLYALPGGPPFRPGLICDGEGGTSIDVEVWRMPMAEFGSFVAAIPAPLGIGKVHMADGRELSSFICEQRGLIGAEEITQFGGWRAYLAHRNA